MKDTNRGTDPERRLDGDVERRGRSPPSPAGLEAAAADLLANAEPVEDLQAVRLSLVGGSDRAVAERLVASLSDQVAVVGSSLPEFDPANPRLEVLVETDHDRNIVAAGLADVGPVEGVVMGEVSLGDAADGEGDDHPADALSIYRLDDHLVVTEDFGALVERFDEELADEQARAATRAVAEDVDTLRDRVAAVDDRVDELERHLDAVDGELDEVAATADDAAATAEDAATTVVDAAGTAEDAWTTATEAATTADDLREAVEALDAELDEVAAAVDEAEFAELSERVESEVATWLEVEQVFAPTADRVDGDGRHPDLGSAIAEFDAELRRTHRLREAGLLWRLRWLLTGELPGD